MKSRQIICISLILYFCLNNSIILSTKLPVIAILANPEPYNAHPAFSSSVNYQYVRWLEQSRADVVVIQPWYNETQIDDLLTKVNGVIWLGGDRDLNLSAQFEQVANMTLRKIMEIYDTKNISIPLWATCQGFELLHSLIVGTTEVLGSFPTFGYETPLILEENINLNSKMFSLFDPEDLVNLQTKKITAQFHNLGVSEKEYQKYPKLGEVLKITSHGIDTEGKKYISSVEGRKYPIYSVLFHPEMVAYNKIDIEGIPQSIEAIKVAQLFSNFFISEAKKNNNTMSYEEMEKFYHLDSFTKTPVEDEGWYFYYFSKSGTRDHNTNIFEDKKIINHYKHKYNIKDKKGNWGEMKKMVGMLKYIE